MENIGIDVHNTESQICMLAEGGELIERRIRTEPARFAEVLGVDLVVLDQEIDTTTPAGRLLFHVLAAIAEFERDLISDRVLAGLKRAHRHANAAV